MKTIILILLSLSLRAQFTVVAVFPKEAFPEDTITIWSLYKGEDKMCHFTIGYPFQAGQAHSITPGEFAALPKLPYGNDSVYVFKIKLHPWLPLGWCIASSDWNAANQGIYFKIVLPVGIAELSHDKPKVVYYDWLGNIVQPEPNKVLFMNDKRKVVIVE